MNIKLFRQTCLTVGTSQMYIPPPSCHLGGRGGHRINNMLLKSEDNLKVVLHGSPRSPDIHDLSECHRLYHLGIHIDQPIGYPNLQSWSLQVYLLQVPLEFNFIINRWIIYKTTASF